MLSTLRVMEKTMSTEKKVDVLERILNCGESMRDVHDAVAAMKEFSR